MLGAKLWNPVRAHSVLRVFWKLWVKLLHHTGSVSGNLFYAGYLLNSPLSELWIVGEIWGIPPFIWYQCNVRWLNALRPQQNGCHSADDILKLIFVNENIGILIKNPQKLFTYSPVGKKPALVQVMAWHWIGDKPLSDSMMANFADAFMVHLASMS